MTENDDDLDDEEVISRVAPGLFTDIDREWRKKWLKAQELSPREKAYHFFYLWDNPEFRKARLNPLRRIWQVFSLATATLHNINSLVNVDHKSKVVAKHTFSLLMNHGLFFENFLSTFSINSIAFNVIAFIKFSIHLHMLQSNFKRTKV